LPETQFKNVHEALFSFLIRMSELPYDYQNAELTGKEIYTGIYRLSSNGVPAALMSFTAMSLFKTYAPESISTANTSGASTKSSMICCPLPHLSV